jgi:hypothetical protein
LVVKAHAMGYHTRMASLILSLLLPALGDLGEPPATPAKGGVAYPPAAVAKAFMHEYPRVDPKAGKSIARGLAYLKKAEDYRLGARALAGLTMLHCGLPPSDPAVTKNAKLVRAGARGLTATYELSLCLLFLDRLGNPKDRDLIRHIASQLIAGQGIQGGWNYQCFPLNQSQEKYLLTLLKPYVSAAAGQPFVPKLAPEWTKAGKGIPSDLRYLPAVQYRPGQQMVLQANPWHEDNSLTQFAILALWAAQKHDVPVERPLALVEARFRASQFADGSWTYKMDPTTAGYRVDSMTCAGLLGLAVGHGIQSPDLEKFNPARKGDKAPVRKAGADPAIEKALLFLSQKIGAGKLRDLGADVVKANAMLMALQMRLPKAGLPERRLIVKQMEALMKDRRVGRGTILGFEAWGDLYYLWSLERVAVTYNLRTIGGKDWYAWGAPILLASQLPDGSWSDRFPGVPDTCFALLFLNRANVVQDLTRNLNTVILSPQTGGRLSDPTYGMSPGQREALSRAKDR